MSKLQESQRVLFLQCGGSLGAYEAEVYQASYERITKKDREREIRDGPVLDIVAETPIVAIDAAIIVRYVVGNSTMGAPQKD